MSELITTELVVLDHDLGADKLAVIRSLAEVVGSAGRASDVEQLVHDAEAREATSPTGLPGGIAIPHCRTTGVAVPTVAFARLSPPVDFGAKDGPADLAFLIAAPAGGDSTHLELLTKLARALVKPTFTAALRAAETPHRGGRDRDRGPRDRPPLRRRRRTCPTCDPAGPGGATDTTATPGPGRAAWSP